MDLTWCRFNGHGWYENGGRFLAAVNLPATDRPLSLVTHVDDTNATLFRAGPTWSINPCRIVYTIGEADDRFRSFGVVGGGSVGKRI